MQAPPVVFDRHSVRQNRTKALDKQATEPDLFRFAKTQLLDRLLDVTVKFHQALVSGPGCHAIAAALTDTHQVGSVTAAHFRNSSSGDATIKAEAPRTLICDEEWFPFGQHSFDLIISSLALHWVNDLPGALIQMRRGLCPDGLFLAMLFGGSTLQELRECLMEAETRLKGGAAPRVSPFVDVRDAGNLLVRAGFALPVADMDTVIHEYDNLAALFEDIRTMGESNAVAERFRGLTTKRLFTEAEAIYKDRFATPSGRLNATFDFITLTGWAPSDTQQTPLAPGSAQHRLSDALDTDENPL